MSLVWSGQPSHGPNNQDRQSKCKAYGKQCNKCHKMNHFATMCKQSGRTQQKQNHNRNQPDVGEIGVENEESSEISGFIAALCATPPTSPQSSAPILAALRDKTKSKWNTLPVPHYVHDPGINTWCLVNTPIS